MREIDSLILKSIIRAGGKSYGAQIKIDIAAYTNKDYSFGSIYAAIERLESYGAITTHHGEATRERGFRRKLYCLITNKGKAEISS